MTTAFVMQTPTSGYSPFDPAGRVSLSVASGQYAGSSRYVALSPAVRVAGMAASPRTAKIPASAYHFPLIIVSLLRCLHRLVVAARLTRAEARRQRPAGCGRAR